ALSAGMQNCINCTLASCPLYIGRRNVEGGNRFDDLRHTSYRFLGGLRGDINDRWSWDVSASFARLIYSETYFNDSSTRRLPLALPHPPPAARAARPAPSAPRRAGVRPAARRDRRELRAVQRVP